MARPRRPSAESTAVCEAACIVARETGYKSIQALAREIAERVMTEVLIQIDGLTDDPFVIALQRASASPFVMLATCPEIDTASAFVDRRVQRMRDRYGRHLTQAEQQVERRNIIADVSALLTRRYARQLRDSLILPN
jgi:hypothetical protein